MATTSEIQGRNLKFYITKSAQEAAALASTEPEAVCFTEAGIILNGQVYAEPNVAQTNYGVTVASSTPSGLAKRYNIKQAATGLDVNIDIPKDMVVSSGTVQAVAANSVSNGSGGYLAAGTYLVLTLANATSDKVYINVGSLIEYVTSGSGTNDAIQIAVNSSTHKVTATVKSGSITNDMLAGSIAYGKLAGSIPKSKLDSGVQASLGKADTALQSHQAVALASGTNNGTLKITVNGSATDNVAVKGLKAGAFMAGDAKANDTAIFATDYGIPGDEVVTYPTERPVNIVVTDVGGALVGALVSRPASKLEQGSGNGKVKYTNEVGEAFDIAVKGLGSAAYKGAGSAAENVPLIGTAISSKNGYPLLADSNGKIKPGSAALGTAAYKADTYFATQTGLVQMGELLQQAVDEIADALVWH